MPEREDLKSKMVGSILTPAVFSPVKWCYRFSAAYVTGKMCIYGGGAGERESERKSESEFVCVC